MVLSIFFLTRHCEASLKNAYFRNLFLFQLLNEEGGLEKYQKQKNSKSLTVCCGAINEAVNNIWEKKRQKSSDDIKLEVAVAFLAKLENKNNLEDENRTDDWTVDNDDNYFEAVTVGLPTFNTTLLYDVVKNCEMTEQFCKVLVRITTVLLY